MLSSDIVFDVGRSINPAVDLGQIEGAFVFGLGAVLSEHVEHDEATGVLRASFCFQLFRGRCGVCHWCTLYVQRGVYEFGCWKSRDRLFEAVTVTLFNDWSLHGLLPPDP